MNKDMLNGKFLVAAGLILAAAFTRLIPHYPNFTAVSAIALFGGTYFTNKKAAFIVPLLAMFLTDLVLGFHKTMWAVYLSLALIVMIGFLLANKKRTVNVIGATLASSVLFFVITNFAQWLSDPFYAKTGAGLVQCFTMAIPFFQYSILGDLFFVGVLFGAFELAMIKFHEPVKIKV